MFKSTYQAAVDKATQSTLPEPDWNLSLAVVDLINNRQHKDSPKTPEAVLEPLKKRFLDKRRQVKFLAIQLIDIIVKNCNEIGWNAIFGTDYVSQMVLHLEDEYEDENINSQFGPMLNTWHKSFQNVATSPSRPIWYRNLEAAMYMASKQSRGVFGDFSTMVVKKEDLILHKYQPAIVLNAQSKALYEGQKEINNMTDEQIMALIQKQEEDEKKKKEAAEQERKLAEQEDAELQKALELSKQEANRAVSPQPAAQRTSSGYPDIGALNLEEEPPKIGSPANFGGVPGAANPAPVAKTVIEQVDMPLGEYEHEDQNLIHQVVNNENNIRNNIQIYGSDSSEYLIQEDEQFLKNFSKSIDMLNLRIKSMQNRQRSIYTDSTAQQLISSIMNRHQKLHEIMANIDGQRQHFEQFQNTMTEIGHARLAIDEMRADKIRQAEAERLKAEEEKRQKMLEKLEALRQNKQRILEQKRQQALMSINNFRNFQTMGGQPSYGQPNYGMMNYGMQAGPSQPQMAANSGQQQLPAQMQQPMQPGMQAQMQPSMQNQMPANPGQQMGQPMTQGQPIQQMPNGEPMPPNYYQVLNKGPENFQSYPQAPTPSTFSTFSGETETPPQFLNGRTERSDSFGTLASVKLGPTNSFRPGNLGGAQTGAQNVALPQTLPAESVVESGTDPAQSSTTGLEEASTEKNLTNSEQEETPKVVTENDDDALIKDHFKKCQRESKA